MNEKKQPMRQFELSRLKNSTDDVIKDKSLSEGFKNPVVKNVTDKIDTKAVQKTISGTDFVEKIAALRAAKQAGKKLMGAVPLLGAGYAALSGDPAMAAEELAGDAVDLAPTLATKLGSSVVAGPVGIAALGLDAIKPTPTGNVEEERQMIAERDAQVNYNNSPAHLARLKALQGMR